MGVAVVLVLFLLAEISCRANGVFNPKLILVSCGFKCQFSKQRHLGEA